MMNETNKHATCSKTTGSSRDFHLTFTNDSECIGPMCLVTYYILNEQAVAKVMSIFVQAHPTSVWF